MKKLLFLGIVALTGCLWADRTANQGWVAKNFAPSNLVVRVEALEGATESDPVFTTWKTNASVAVGAAASAPGVGAVQLGTGTNVTARTLQFRGYTVIGADGKIPSARLPEITEQDPMFNIWLARENVEVGNLALAGLCAIAIGNEAQAQAMNSIGIGYGSVANDIGAIAIGRCASAEAEGAVQIGTGINSNPHTLQFGEYLLLNADGSIPADRLTSVCAMEIDPMYMAWTCGEHLFAGSGACASDYGVALGRLANAGKSGVAIGDGAIGADIDGTTPGGIAIGAGATAMMNEGIAIGSSATSGSKCAVAIGKGATASGEGAVQLGTGNNVTNNALQFRSFLLLDASGKIPAERLTPAAVLSPIQAMTAEQKAALKTALGL